MHGDLLYQAGNIMTFDEEVLVKSLSSSKTAHQMFRYLLSAVHERQWLVDDPQVGHIITKLQLMRLHSCLIGLLKDRAVSFCPIRRCLYSIGL
jgi:hypothetical protein